MAILTSAVQSNTINHDSKDPISGQFLFYHDHYVRDIVANLVCDIKISQPQAKCARVNI